MKDYLEEWFNDLINRNGSTWRKSVIAIGICRMHTGPSVRFASLTIEFSPSDHFVFEDTLSDQDRKIIQERNWHRSIIFGVLDVMLTVPLSPIKKIKITINQIEYNEIESTPIAFRIAARDAARKAFKEHFPGT